MINQETPVIYFENFRFRFPVQILRAHVPNFLRTKYYNKSVALVADTAHVIHPLAGQGLNQGIKDIDCLSSLIATEGVRSSTLDTYQKQRKQDTENMLLITDTINSIFSSNSRILHGARQAAFKTIETLPSFKKILIKYAMGEREKR